MSEIRCSACGQTLLNAPTRCDICDKAIQPFAAFKHVSKDSVCSPSHRDCETVQPDLF